jgi:PrcB C-terminal
LVLAGCGGTSRPIAYEDLTSKVGPLEFTHITVDRSRSRAELLEVLQRNNPGRKIHLPPVDYTREETFLVAAGPRSSTGYALRIVRAQEQGDHVQVVVHEETPSLGDPVEARVTYPFRLHLKWLGRP